MRDCESEFSRLVGTYVVTDREIASSKDRDIVAAKVQQLCECMESAGYYDHLDIYSISRSEALRIALEQHLFQFQQTNVTNEQDRCHLRSFA